ncbi:MAG: DsbA family oxidoreductase [Meiothermus sp.]|nr:DsbA family oxidoreductase [Meiothermus sp.]
MKIEVFSDIACPWCYIGERRLFKALKHSGLEAEVRWMPFQLQPGLPPEGRPWEEFMAQKFGGTHQMEMAFAQTARAGAPEGIEFRFDRVARAINTVDPHRLILWAGRESGQEQQWALASALFKAHFVDGKNLNDPADLLGVAASVGLEAEQVGQFLESGDLRAEVEQSQQLAGGFGVQGVPFFIFNRKYALSGAQPLEVFVQVLEQVSREGVQV